MEAFRQKLPESIRFQISGAIGSVIFYILNELIIKYNPYNYEPITVAFFFAYLISIWIQHFLHSTLVYGWTQPYVSGLLSTYAGYSLALVLSPPISYCLANYAGFNSSQVWLGTLIITGIGNYFLLSALMSDKKKVDPKDFL